MQLHNLRVLLGKLFFISQCCLPAWVFLNRILATTRVCPAVDEIPLSAEFQKCINWFACYLPVSNSIYIIHDETRVPANVYVDVCNTGAGAIYDDWETYHAMFSGSVLKQDHPICHLETLNAVAAVWT